METIQFTTSQNEENVSDEMMKTIEVYTESQDEFPVDFDEFWQWCGYARKDNAKRVLEKNFTEDVDFNLRRIAEVQKEGKREVKRPTNKIMLTNDCAKAFAMLAQTPKGREVRRYFIECEKQLKALSIEAHQRIKYLEELNFEMLLLKEEIVTMKAEKVRGKESEEPTTYLHDVSTYRTTTYPACPNYRKALTNHIQRYSSSSRRSAQTLYNQLYRKFNDQYQIDLYAEVELEEITVIEWLEEKGLIMYAYVLATQIFRLDAEC